MEEQTGKPVVAWCLAPVGTRSRRARAPGGRGELGSDASVALDQAGARFRGGGRRKEELCRWGGPVHTYSLAPGRRRTGAQS
jgi:hypothetical protein